MKSDLTDVAKNLRKRSTEAEKLLWKHLRRKSFGGLKFKRQQPLEKYVVDFVCFDKRLVVKLDGGQHNKDKGKDKDIERDTWLQERGFKVLRFWNNEVLSNMEGVLLKIEQSVLSHPPPSPSHQGRGIADARPGRGG